MFDVKSLALHEAIEFAGKRDDVTYMRADELVEIASKFEAFLMGKDAT